jgi:hypothetical protein
VLSHLAGIGEEHETTVGGGGDRPQRLDRPGGGGGLGAAGAGDRQDLGIVAPLERDLPTHAGDRVDDQAEPHMSS